MLPGGTGPHEPFGPNCRTRLRTPGPCRGRGRSYHPVAAAAAGPSARGRKHSDGWTGRQGRIAGRNASIAGRDTAAHLFGAGAPTGEKVCGLRRLCGVAGGVRDGRGLFSRQNAGFPVHKDSPAPPIPAESTSRRPDADGAVAAHRFGRRAIQPARAPAALRGEAARRSGPPGPPGPRVRRVFAEKAGNAESDGSVRASARRGRWRDFKKGFDRCGYHIFGSRPASRRFCS